MVRIFEKYPFKIDACIGTCVIDAKSLLGMIGLGINRKIGIRIQEKYSSIIEDELFGIRSA